MSTLAELKRLPETKAERKAFVDGAVNEILSGIHNPLAIEILLKNLEETIKEIRSNEMVKDLINSEIRKFPENVFEYGNVKFTKKNQVRYDYTNDSTWCLLNNKLKAREALLKNVTTPIADAETGEMIEPAVKKSTESYSITFIK